MFTFRNVEVAYRFFGLIGMCSSISRLSNTACWMCCVRNVHCSYIVHGMHTITHWPFFNVFLLVGQSAWVGKLLERSKPSQWLYSKYFSCVLKRALVVDGDKREGRMIEWSVTSTFFVCPWCLLASELAVPVTNLHGETLRFVLVVII